MIALWVNLIQQTSSLTFLNPFSKALFLILASFPIARVAYLLHRYNLNIPRYGMRDASTRVYRHFYHHLSLVEFQSQSPTLYLSNHPGIGDSLAVLQIIPTHKLKIVVVESRFFNLMTNLHPYLIVIPKDMHKSITAIKKIELWLQEGGDVLLYPAGTIEPDPDMGTDEPLVAWSRLPELLAARARKKGHEFNIQPLRISSVFYAKYFRHSFVRGASTASQRSNRAAFLSIAFPPKTGNGIVVRPYPSISSNDFSAQKLQELYWAIYPHKKRGKIN